VPVGGGEGEAAGERLPLIGLLGGRRRVEDVQGFGAAAGTGEGQRELDACLGGCLGWQTCSR
jgi:hypothetical protein